MDSWKCRCSHVLNYRPATRLACVVLGTTGARIWLLLLSGFLTRRVSLPTLPRVHPTYPFRPYPLSCPGLTIGSGQAARRPGQAGQAATTGLQPVLDGQSREPGAGGAPQGTYPIATRRALVRVLSSPDNVARWALRPIIIAVLSQAQPMPCTVMQHFAAPMLRIILRRWYRAMLRWAMHRCADAAQSRAWLSVALLRPYFAPLYSAFAVHNNAPLCLYCARHSQRIAYALHSSTTLYCAFAIPRVTVRYCASAVPRSAMPLPCSAAPSAAAPMPLFRQLFKSVVEGAPRGVPPLPKPPPFSVTQPFLDQADLKRGVKDGYKEDDPATNGGYFRTN